MSSRAEVYVRRVTRRPLGEAAGARLHDTDRLLFRELAKDFNEELGCAFGRVKRYATNCGWSERKVQRALVSLEECGLIQRRPMQSDRDGAQTSNEYDFPLMGSAAERPMSSAAESDGTPMSKAAEGQRQARRDAVYDHKRKPMPVQMRLACHRAGDNSCHPPGDSMSSPLESLGDKYKGKEPPRPPSAAVHGENPRDWTGERPKATASANATATTLPPQGVSGAQNGVGSSGTRSGGRVRARDLPGVEELDGEDAAWHAEVTRVMCELGVVSDGMRRVLERALRLEAIRSKCTIAGVGQLAIQRWNEYTNPQVLRQRYVSVKRFFREGLWLRPGAWTLSLDWYREQRSPANRWPN